MVNIPLTTTPAVAVTFCDSEQDVCNESEKNAVNIKFSSNSKIFFLIHRCTQKTRALLSLSHLIVPSFSALLVPFFYHRIKLISISFNKDAQHDIQFGCSSLTKICMLLLVLATCCSFFYYMRALQKS